MVEYGLPPERIIGHRDVDPTRTCPGSFFDLEVVRRMSLESTGTLAGAERWHHEQAAGKGPLATLRRAAAGAAQPRGPGEPAGWPPETLAELESSAALPTDEQVPEYARALGVSEHQVLEAFTLAAMDYHRQRLAEASAKLGVLHAQPPRREKNAQRARATMSSPSTSPRRSANDVLLEPRIELSTGEAQEPGGP